MSIWIANMVIYATNHFYGPEKPVDWGIPSRHRFQYDLDDQGVPPF